MTRNQRRKVTATRKANRLGRAEGMAQAAINHRTRVIVKSNLASPKERDYHAGMISSVYTGNYAPRASGHGVSYKQY